MPAYLIESLLLEQGQYFLLQKHINRLSRSADYFNFTFNRHHILQLLDSLAKRQLIGQFKVRLLVDNSGHITLNCDALPAVSASLYATLSPIAMDSRNPFLYYKTSERGCYPTASWTQEYLLFNERFELTEFVNGNVALLIDGEWLTPPVNSGLLPGTFREQLIEDGIIKESVLFLVDLNLAEKIAFINSVRKWRPITWQATN